MNLRTCSCMERFIFQNYVLFYLNNRSKFPDRKNNLNSFTAFDNHSFSHEVSKNGNFQVYGVIRCDVSIETNENDGLANGCIRAYF